MITEQYGPLSELVSERLEPGTSVLLSGPVHSGHLGLCFDLLTLEDDESTGSLFVTTDLRADVILDEFQKRGERGEYSQYHIVDARGDQSSRTGDVADNVTAVSSPADLTGIGIGVVRGLDTLQRQGANGDRLGVHSISTLTQYLDASTVFKFLHTLTGRCAATSVSCVGTLNASIHDHQTVSLVASAFDVHVEIRETEHSDGFEARILGSTANPTPWFSLR